MSKIISIWILAVLITGCLAIVPEEVKSAEITSSWSYPVGLPFVMDASPEGDYVAIGDTDGYVRLFHESSNVPVWSIGPYSSIKSISVSENGNYVAFVQGSTVQIIDKQGRYISGFSNKDADAGTIESKVDISEDGIYAVYGLSNTRVECVRTIGFVGEFWYGTTTATAPEVVMSGDGNICVGYATTSSTVNVFWGREYVYQNTGTIQASEFTFTDPTGNILDVDVDYSGSTIAVGSATTFGIISSGWVWQINTATPVNDVAVSRDGSVIAALTNSGVLYSVKDGVAISLPTTNTNVVVCANGNYIVCSDAASITVYDTDLNVVTQYTGQGFLDGEGNFKMGSDGHNVYGRSGTTLHHLEIMPDATLTYTVEYTMGGYDHVNSTTEFTIEGEGVAEYSQIYYEIDGKGWVGYSGTFNLTGLIEGPHTIGFYIVDANGYNTVPTYVEVWLDPYGIFDEIEARLTMLEWSVMDIWTSMDTVNATLVDVQTDIIELSTNLTIVQNTISKIQQNITDLWENNTLNQDDILTLFAYYGLLDQNITELWENNTLNQDDILTLFAYYGLLDQNITELWENNTLNQDDILTLFTLCGLLDQNITDLWENNTLNLDEITHLWENNTINQNDIAVIQQDIEGIQGQITNITGNTTAIFQNITTIINRIDSLEANGTLTSQNITTILTGLSSLNSALADVNSDAAALNATVTTLESDHTLTKQSLADVKTNVSALDTSLTETRTVVDQLNTDLDAMDTNVEGLGEEVNDNSDDIAVYTGSLFGAYALATVGLILGIIGFALGLISFRKKGNQ